MSTVLFTTTPIGALRLRSIVLAELIWQRVGTVVDWLSSGAGTIDGSGKVGLLLRWTWSSMAEHGHFKECLVTAALLMLAATWIRQIAALPKDASRQARAATS